MIELPEYLDESFVLLPRLKYDCAIIGSVEIKGESIVVYCFNKVIELLMIDMNYDEAIDFFYYNMNSNNIAYFNKIKEVVL